MGKSEVGCLSPGEPSGPSLLICKMLQFRPQKELAQGLGVIFCSLITRRGRRGRGEEGGGGAATPATAAGGTWDGKGVDHSSHTPGVQKRVGVGWGVSRSRGGGGAREPLARPGADLKFWTNLFFLFSFLFPFGLCLRPPPPPPSTHSAKWALSVVAFQPAGSQWVGHQSV